MMNNESKYNLLNALIYEVIMLLCRYYPLKSKPWIRQILKNCLPDWAAFRAELEIKNVDKQVEELQATWEEQDKQKQKPIYTEKQPDGSKAQDLLGGEMRLRAPWVGDHEAD